MTGKVAARVSWSPSATGSPGSRFDVLRKADSADVAAFTTDAAPTAAGDHLIAGHTYQYEVRQHNDGAYVASVPAKIAAVWP